MDLQQTLRSFCIAVAVRGAGRRGIAVLFLSPGREEEVYRLSSDKRHQLRSFSYTLVNKRCTNRQRKLYGEWRDSEKRPRNMGKRAESICLSCASIHKQAIFRLAGLGGGIRLTNCSDYARIEESSVFQRRLVFHATSRDFRLQGSCPGNVPACSTHRRTDTV